MRTVRRAGEALDQGPEFARFDGVHSGTGSSLLHYDENTKSTFMSKIPFINNFHIAKYILWNLFRMRDIRRKKKVIAPFTFLPVE